MCSIVRNFLGKFGSNYFYQNSIIISTFILFYYTVLLIYNSHKVKPFSSIQLNGFEYIPKGVQTLSSPHSRTYSLPFSQNLHFSISSSLVPTNSRQTFCLSVWICLLWTFHVNEIIQYI
jgi:hypothetical protein